MLGHDPNCLIGTDSLGDGSSTGQKDGGCSVHPASIKQIHISRYIQLVVSTARCPLPAALLETLYGGGMPNRLGPRRYLSDPSRLWHALAMAHNEACLQSQLSSKPLE
ncbi:uncharacterized protein CANTADRAFT_313617 [Suhomyces tanzawaensis NRRL Y-17324]|uniref:Uncharacterized protein n=1 Tax=Suhomyces tanzawaensis NRRL Y-17324 TaxID=984487 RepID=A0A1E4SDK2_9ASCO|nr:uncharacterized protein CANTADRAFT_313617 [Suhomyces tanzawaensis NRRL Y-17324]ODV77563.1 hypothetical protein CANTADRAFT_313617 [Suhomyces tanzawaensis NRRL Y-17324]